MCSVLMMVEFLRVEKHLLIMIIFMGIRNDY